MSTARIIVACFLFASVGTQQLSACAGWQTSAQARMECCERATDCEGPSMADVCCAAGETADNATVDAPVALPVPVPALTLLVPVAAQAAAPRGQTDATAHFHSFRNAVLLI